MRVRTLAGWLVLGVAVAVVVRVTGPDPEHGRTEDAEEADTERGFEHSPGDHDSEWDSHVDDAVAMSRPQLPVRHVQCETCGWFTDDVAAHAEFLCGSLPPEAHGHQCPCVVCTTYQPHEIVGNWHPSKGPRSGLYLVKEGDGA